MATAKSIQARRILIIEDDQELGEILQYNLSRAGYSASIIGDGKAAIQLLAQERPDLILLDVMLPGASGWEVCRFLEGDPQLRQIPVIIFTAKSAREDFDQARRFNVAGFFTKPYSTPDVLRHVEKILAPKRENT